MEETYGQQIKNLRVSLGMTQNQVATALNVTPGYICNVENGRTAMSLKILIYYAKLTGVSLDSLVGRIDADYKSTALDNELLAKLSKLSDDQKLKAIKTMDIWMK